MQDTSENASRGRQDIVKVSGTTSDQREVWREAAGQARMSLSEWLREAADAVVISGTTAADLRAAIAALRTEIGRGVGNNLNQIARALNTDIRAGRRADCAPHEAALEAAARDVAIIRRRTEAMLRRVERAGQRRRRR
jgi:Bacterial mobilisation protein (MobC)